MVSISKLPEKERRKTRRHNRVVMDLRNSKYLQKVIPNKKRFKKLDEDQENE